MTTLDLLLWIAITLLALAGSAWCSGFETGIYSVNRVRLNLRVARAEPRAITLRHEIDRLSRALATILIANTLFGNLISLGITKLLSTQPLSDIALVALNLAVVTPLLVVLGEALPKELFRVEADRLNYWTVPVLVWIRRLLTLCLLIPLVEAVASFVARSLRVVEPGALASPRHTIAALVKEGARHGILTDAQTSMVDRALLMRDTLVRGEMIPWSKVRTIPVTGNRRQLAAWLQSQSFSAYPVLSPDGALLGVVNHLDLCLRLDTPLQRLITPHVSLSPDMSVRDALLVLRRADVLIGIVMLDDKPLGIVTPKDLIEPLLRPDAPDIR